MKSRIVFLVAFIGVVLAFATRGPALAQEQKPTLGERPSLPVAVEVLRPSLEPDNGIQPQSPAPAPQQRRPYTVRAGVTGGVLFDDNLYSKSGDKLSDKVFIVKPEAAIEYKNNNLQSVTNVFVESKSHEKYSDEDHINYGASVGTTYAPENSAQIQSRVGYGRSHEYRGAADSALLQFDRPVALDQLDGALIVNKRYNDWWTSLGGASSWYDYKDPTIQGTSIDQSYRNGVVSVGTARLGHVVAPLTSAFVETSANWRNFKQSYFYSSGYRVVGGLLFDPGKGATVKGEFFAGYMQQNYLGDTLEDIRTFTYGTAIAFRLHDDVTATVTGRREAKESILNGGVSVLESSISGRIDFQLTPRLTFGFGTSFLMQDFTGANRVDESLAPLVGLKYTLTPNIIFGLDYRRVDFVSSGAGVGGYDRNAVLTSLIGRF